MSGIPPERFYGARNPSNTWRSLGRFAWENRHHLINAYQNLRGTQSARSLFSTKKRKNQSDMPPIKRARVALSGSKAHQIADGQPLNQWVSTKVRKTKKLKNKSKKKLKVGKTFRKKVTQVMQAKKCYGILSEIRVGKLGLDPIGQNRQARLVLADWCDGLGLDGWFFTPDYFIHRAAVMFNGFPNNKVWNPVDNPPFAPWKAQGAIAAEPILQSLKFTVQNSYVKILIKNNTRRTFTLLFYNTGSKKPGQSRSNNYDHTGLIGDNPSYLGNCVKMWNDCIQVDDGGNSLIGKQDTDSSYLSTMRGALPTDSISWKNKVNYGLTKVILAPGQTETYTIQGPKDMELDVAKCFSAGDGYWERIQKYSRSPLVIVMPDMCDNGANDAGFPYFAPGINVGDNKYEGNLLLEAEGYCKIAMPEQAGFNLRNSTAGPVPMNFRRPLRARYNWSATGSTLEGLVVLNQQSGSLVDVKTRES